MDNLQFVDLVDEKSRTYIFATGKVTYPEVKRLCVRPSGTHRLELADGRKVIVPAGWLAIEVDAASWSA